MKVYQATMFSPLPRLQNPANLPSIQMISPAVMNTTERLTLWLRCHSNEAIPQHHDSHPWCSIWIHWMKHQSVGLNGPNLNDYHTDPLEISSTFWIVDITGWWHQQEETQWWYTELSDVASDIISIIPHAVGVEASFTLGRYVIGWSQWKTTGETLHEKVVVSQLATAINRISAGDEPVLDRTNPENDSETMGAVEDRELHRIAKVHNPLERWQGSQNLHTTQKESHSQNNPITAIKYISDTEVIIKASWSLSHNDGAPEF